MSKKQHINKVVPFASPVVTYTSSLVGTDSHGTPRLYFVKDIFSQKDLATIAADVWSPSFLALAHSRKDDCRGKQQTVDLGVWMRRGGSRTFHLTPASKTYIVQYFINKHQPIWDLVYRLMQRIDHDFVVRVRKRDKCDFGAFSYAAVNVESSTKTHQDSKDFIWCCVIPFGDFTGGSLCFPYCGIQLQAKACDAVVFDSHWLWHKVNNTTSGKRGSIALSNHKTVVNEYL